MASTASFCENFTAERTSHLMITGESIMNLTFQTVMQLLLAC